MVNCTEFFRKRVFCYVKKGKPAITHAWIVSLVRRTI